MKASKTVGGNMCKKVIFFGIVLLLLGSILTPLVVQIRGAPDEPTSVFVDDAYTESTNGWGIDHFDTIQAGIDAVGENGTVYVYAGSYQEKIIVNKTLALRGDSYDDTIITWGGRGDVVTVSAETAVMSGFTIKQSGTSGAGIRITADGIRLTEMKVIDNYHGITISSNNNTITHNIISHNTGAGIALSNANTNVIASNSISRCESTGITIANSYDNTIRENIISSNANYGIGILVYAENNYIYHNNFFNNSNQSADLYTNNYWNMSQSIGGNYWDDYTGSDSDEDGIGDTPYVVLGEFANPDNYPLMSPFNITPSLRLRVPDSVNENETVQVTATISIDAVGIPINEVEILFSDTIYRTDALGVATCYAPSVDTDTDMVLSAQKEGFGSHSTTITIINSDMPTEDQLVITVQSTVTEGEEFQVQITANDVPVADVLLAFADDTYYTGDNGSVSLVAPLVASDIDYLLTASKDNYKSTSVSISIVNYESPLENGWIIGLITDAEGNPLVDAWICVILSNGDLDTTSTCHLTDKNGTYNHTLQAGSYTLQASKIGYKVESQTIIVSEDEATTVDFILDRETTAGTSIDTNEQLIEEKITTEVKDNNVGARVSVEPDAHQVSYYSDDLTINVESTQETISCSVSADDDTPGTILVFYLGEGSLSDLDDLFVTYDGETITEVTDLVSFFNEQENTQPRWFRFTTTHGRYVFIQIPHFSDHTITIASLVEQVIDLTILLVYSFVIIITAVAATAHLRHVWRR